MPAIATVKVIPVVTETRTVTLVMDENEAGLLRAVCQMIGGAPEGPRGWMNNINDALEQAGVEIPYTDLTGSLHVTKA